MVAKKTDSGEKIKRGKGAPEKNRPSFWETVRALFLEPVDILTPDQKPPRIDELDLLRGYAIFGFIIYHGVLLLGNKTVVYDSLLGFIAYILFWPIGGKAFFQILIGIYLVYARSSTQTLVKRGLALLVAGYAFNVVRFLPMIVGVSRGTLDIKDFLFFSNIGDIISLVDIFQFAGLAFLAFALIRRLFRGVTKPIHWLCLALPVIIISPFLIPLITGNIYIDRFLEPLWVYSEYIWFPFFPTFCYTLLGAMFGCILIKIRSFRHHERSFMIIAILTFALGILLTDIFGQQSGYFYFKIIGPDFIFLSLEIVIKVLGYVMFHLALIVWLNRYVPQNIFFRFYRYLSYNITLIFIWQWIIFGWISVIYFRIFWQQDVPEVLAVIAITTVLAIIFTELTKKGIKFVKGRAGAKKEGAAA